MIPLLLFLLGCAIVYLGVLETAFGAMLRLSMRLLAERSGREGEIGKYLEDPILFFIPTRLALGLTIGLTAFGFAVLFGPGLRGTGFAIAATIGVVLVCQHLVPVLIVRRDPEGVLEVLLPSFEKVAGLLRPVTRAVSRNIRERRERNGVEAGPAAPEAQPEQPGEGHPDEAHHLSEREERRLLHSILEFGNTLVREVMTPRPDIAAIRVDATLAELRQQFIEEQYSRMPVYSESLDNIAGIIFMKDLVRLTDVPDHERPIPKLVRPAYFVPETKRVADLLKEFQIRQVQLAIVVDEYGGTAGLVTLEDLLEEIVGEIRDEYDVETEPIIEEAEGTFVISGKSDIDEVAERLGVDIPREGFETMGGFLLSQLGRVPAVGETFGIDNLNVEVLEAERRRVTKVRIRLRDAVSQPAGE